MTAAPPGASMGNCISRCCTSGSSTRHRSNPTKPAAPANSRQHAYERNRILNGQNCNGANDVLNVGGDASNTEGGIGNEVEAEKALLELYDRYKDTEDVNCILADGCERLCSDLDLKPDDFRVLVLAHALNASSMCCFTRAEFLNGSRKLGVHSIGGFKSVIPSLIKNLICDKISFKIFYKWTFSYGLESGQRSLSIEMALVLWPLVFTENEPPILKRWLLFLEKSSSVRSIARDTWDMFLNLVEQVGDDLSAYDESEAWPSLFDDFVEWENDRKNQNVSEDVQI